MTTTFESGSAVKSGYYFNASRWALEPVAKDGERLPGGKGKWMPIPTVAALALTPILGATFLMFLPLIGFVLAFQAIATPIVHMLRGGAKDLAATMSPGWIPGEAHLTGKPPESAAAEEKGPIAADGKLDAIEKEIEEKRRLS
jgi:hypothetical protein